MAVTPLFLTVGDRFMATAPATTAEAAEGGVRDTKGGSGAETSVARAEETTWAARREEKGAFRRELFFLVYSRA